MQDNVPAKIIPRRDCPNIELSRLAPLTFHTAQIRRAQAHADQILHVIADGSGIAGFSGTEDGVVEGAGAAFLAFDADAREGRAATHG